MNQQQAPAFVVLNHIVPEEARLAGGRGSHYDLMLESHGVLKTWAIDRWPLVDVSDEGTQGKSFTPATQLADHRLAYLSYQGPVSNNRGEVYRVVAGTYRTLFLDDNQWQVELHWQDALGNSHRLHLALQSSRLIILQRS